MPWLLSLVLLAGAAQDELPAVTVSRLWAQYADRMIRQDVDGLTDLFTADARLMEPNQDDLVGRALIRARIKAAASQTTRTSDFKVTPREVTGSNGFILDQGDYIQTIVPNGVTRRATDVYGRYFAVWAEQPDSTWKIARLMLSPKRQPPPR